MLYLFKTKLSFLYYFMIKKLRHNWLGNYYFFCEPPLNFLYYIQLLKVFLDALFYSILKKIELEIFRKKNNFFKKLILNSNQAVLVSDIYISTFSKMANL